MSIKIAPKPYYRVAHVDLTGEVGTNQVPGLLYAGLYASNSASLENESGFRSNLNNFIEIEFNASGTGHKTGRTDGYISILSNEELVLKFMGNPINSVANCNIQSFDANVTFL